ncbi:hypothetical protein [Adlercreutzia sp. ZJ473]|uniref:type IV toxin-antitoxin system AbiEi family antitoxin domain-containing protein n=1 Tax=Adlercreutzia sp. ZJ473 TaxID=2722822 RepID=UPI0015558929|nr:hypothetical protein [Adlercreutzia sp. ZJ473]
MKFTEYISTHHVFKTSELLASCDSPSSAEEQLRIAVKTGKAERIRQGLYASMAGRYEGTLPDSLEVITGIDPEAAVCYHAALDVLGVAHDVSFQREFRTGKLKTAFEYRGIRYVPYPPEANMRTRKVRTDAVGRINVTTKEQTLCDCLARPDRAGGIEESIRAVSSFAYIDCDVVLEMARSLDKTDVSRIGWVLSQKASDWRVPEKVLDELRSLLGKGPYRFGRIKAGSEGWSPEWRLIFPEPIEEVESWITRR